MSHPCHAPNYRVESDRVTFDGLELEPVTDESSVIDCPLLAPGVEPYRCQVVV